MTQQLQARKYKYASWYDNKNYSNLESGECHCGAKATKIAVAETNSVFDTDLEVIRGRCKEHYNHGTQKKWIKKWRNKNCTI